MFIASIRPVSAVIALTFVAGCVADQPASSTATPSTIAGQTVNDQRALDLRAASGFSEKAVVMMMGLKSGRQAIYLEPGTYTANQVATAPARVCGALGERATNIEPIGPAHDGTLPGTDYLVFHCI